MAAGGAGDGMPLPGGNRLDSLRPHREAISCALRLVAGARAHNPPCIEALLPMLKLIKQEALEPSEDLGETLKIAWALHVRRRGGKAGATDKVAPSTILHAVAWNHPDIRLSLERAGLAWKEWQSDMNSGGFEGAAEDSRDDFDVAGPDMRRALQHYRERWEGRPLDAAGLAYVLIEASQGQLDGARLHKMGLRSEAFMDSMAELLNGPPPQEPAKPPRPIELLPFMPYRKWPMSELTRIALRRAELHGAISTGAVITVGRAILAYSTDSESEADSPALAVLRDAYSAAGWSLPESAEGTMVTREMAEVLNKARSLAVATRRQEKVFLRQLLGALCLHLMTAPDPEPGVLALRGAIRETDHDPLAELFEEISNAKASDPTITDDLAIWKEQLGLGAADDGRVSLPGFDPEGLGGRDLLQIRADVEAFASLIAARSLTPPMSVGLFGDWGSGKSFFIRKLKERIQTLADAAALAPSNPAPAYHSRIAQIEFNAWHYVESNLWASMVEHIFRNLRLSEDEEEEKVQERSNQVLEALDSAIARRVKAEQAVVEAEAKRDLAKEALATKLAENEAASKWLARIQAEDVWAAIEFDEQAAGAIREQLSRLGIQRALRTTEDVRGALDEIGSLGARGKVLWSSVFAGPGSGGRVAWLILVLLAVPAVGLALPRIADWLDYDPGTGSVVSTFGQLVTLVGGAAAWMKSQAGRVSGILSKVEAASQAFTNRVQARELELGEEAERLREEVKATEVECVNAHGRVEQAEEEVRTRRAELAELSAERRLARFIEERAASDDYRKHLGILAMVRRDFVKLSQLMKRVREARASGAQPDEGTLDDKHRIDRIVLYIDDLDRCPPFKVVQVLQAVHLLLAFPLFVVVVGVDARWVSNALRRRYRDLWQDGEGRERLAPDSAIPGHGARPHDYLEKIFQVPFWLQPMSPESTASYIEGLVREIRGALPDQPGGDAAAPETPPGSAGRAGSEPPEQGQPEHSSTPVPEGAAEVPGKQPQDAVPPQPASHPAPGRRPDLQTPPVDLSPRGLELDGIELAFMKDLAPVVGRSPRAAKRFVNVYRLLRARIPRGKINRFLGSEAHPGPFQLVLILLAIVTGAPRISQAVFTYFNSAPDEEPLADLLAKVSGESSAKQRGKTAGMSPPLWAKSREWRMIGPFLERWAAGRGQTARASDLKTHLSEVGRYSFRVGQL